MPTPGEEKVLNFLELLVSEGKSGKEEASKDWDKYLDYVQGKQWSNGRPSHKNDIVLNLMELVVERDKGLLTDSRPTVTVQPRQRGLDDSAKCLEKVIHAVWDELDVEQMLQESISYASIFGSVGAEPVYDPQADNGYGNIAINMLDPRTVLFDPFVTKARNVEKGMFSAKESVLPLDMIRDRYPERGHRVKKDASYSQFQMGSATSGVASPAMGPRPLLKRRSRVKDSAIPRAMVREFWIKDFSVNDETYREALDPKHIKKNDSVVMGKRIIEVGQKLFPGGRHIIASPDCVLIDEPNPYYDGLPPPTMMDWRMDIESPWGRSEIAALMSPQMNLNKMASALMENAILMNNSWVIGDADALTPEQWNEVVTDAPGLTIKKRPQRDFRRDYPQPMGGTYFQVISLLVGIIEQLSGLSDTAQGKSKASQQSGVAVEALQMASQTLIRMRARTLESFIQRLFQKVIARIFQFYSKDRLFHLVGPGNEIMEFEFKREQLLRNIQDPTLAFRDFKFVVAPGSSLAMTRVQKGLLAGQLFTLGVIDDEALLEAVEWPNREQVIKRTKEKQAAGQLQPGTGKRGRNRQRIQNRPASQPASAQVGGVSGMAGKE